LLQAPVCENKTKKTIRKRRKKQIQEVEEASCKTAGHYRRQDGNNVRPSSPSSDIIDGRRAASNNEYFGNNIQDKMQLNALTWKTANLVSLCHGRASCRESMQVVRKQQTNGENE
jgi:hypothetical protein